MLISKADYERCLQGFTITDCTVRNRNTYYFVTLADYDQDEDEDELKPPPADIDRITRVVVYYGDKPPAKRWGYATYEGLDDLIAGAAQLPREQFVGADGRGQVVVLGGGVQELEQKIPKGRQGPMRGGVMRLRTIQGLLHVTTGYRGLARRDDRNQWTSLCATLDFMPDREASSSNYGFDDVDAFSPSDYYCVGGMGDVWHFDGSAWERIEFPSNMLLETVCCGGDGQVYIGGMGGAVWKGRRDEWRLIHRDRMTLPFKDMVWFQDRVYCTSDYGLWEIVGDELRECNVPPEIRICSGNLAVADGVMLLAGVYGAAYHDGRTWRQLFSTTAFSSDTP